MPQPQTEALRIIPGGFLQRKTVIDRFSKKQVCFPEEMLEIPRKLAIMPVPVQA